MQTHSCDYCAHPSRAPIIAALLAHPRASSVKLARQLGVGRHTVRRVRLVGHRRGCLPAYACPRCGVATEKGGRCRPCEAAVVRVQQNARDRARWNRRHSVVRSYLLPPIGSTALVRAC